MNTTTIRTRWAAIGAAVAITLGAGGIGLVSATSPSDAVAYVPVEPCRIADTRSNPTFNVGPRNTPIGADDTHVIAARGDNGECTGIPNSATGLQLNVTALSASQDTFVTVWGEGARPNASSLNPALGQPPAPNAVTTGLSDIGTFNVFNRFGSVDIIADVVGYYTDHRHDSTDISNEAGVAFSNDDTVETVGTATEVVASVSIRIPSNGYVNVHASAFWTASVADRLIYCQLTDDASSIDFGTVFMTDSSASARAFGQSISLEQTFPVEAVFAVIGSGRPFNLVCRADSGTVTIENMQMTATFFPTSYAASGPVVVGP